MYLIVYQARYIMQGSLCFSNIFSFYTCIVAPVSQYSVPAWEATTIRSTSLRDPKCEAQVTPMPCVRPMPRSLIYGRPSRVHASNCGRLCSDPGSVFVSQCFPTKAMGGDASVESAVEEFVDAQTTRVKVSTKKMCE